ncbi:MAG: AAA family ATPase [Ktedonobacteraceae bacterium]
MKIRKATKYNSYVKLAFAGLAGSGKTCTALETATYLSEKRIALIEADYPYAADKYAKDDPGDPGFGYTFDTIEMALDDKDVDIEKPYNPKRFIEAIKTIYATGSYDVLVIDGLSSEWEGAGGILEWVDKLKDGNDKKTREAWSVATPEHRRLFTYLLRVRMHVIVTMRAKKETITIQEENGAKVKKMVLDPIQREDVPYLFDVLAFLEEKQIRIDTSHCPTLEEGTMVNRSGPMLAHTLRDWLKGIPAPERPEYDPDAEEQSESVKQMVRKSQGRALKCGAATDTPSWESYVAGVLGYSRATSQITLNEIGLINGNLARRERASAPDGVQV